MHSQTLCAHLVASAPLSVACARCVAALKIPIKSYEIYFRNVFFHALRVNAIRREWIDAAETEVHSVDGGSGSSE